MKLFRGSSMSVCSALAFVSLFFMFLCGLHEACVWAQEAAPVVEPAVKGDTQLPSWITFILSFEFVWKGLTTLIGLGVAWLFKKLISVMGENEAAKEAVRAIEAAVTETYLEFVRHAKASAEDGKLTAEEKKMAMEMAINKAMAIAKGPALALLKAWGIPYIKHLIEKIISKKKAEAIGASKEDPR